jgi:predicted nucleic acid-binding protein
MSPLPLDRPSHIPAGEARREASDLEPTVFGTVGLILRAKEVGHISVVRPHLDDLREREFWLSEALYQHALRRASEK